MNGPRAKVVSFPDAEGTRPRVERLMAEIEIGGRTELVAVLRDERGVRAVSSEGATQGPFVEAALELFGRAFSGAASERPEAGATEPPRRRSPREELRAAVDELITAAVRAGAHAARESPGLKLALETLTEIAEREPAHGLERFIGRFKNAVEFADVEECAMLLGGATQLVADLAEESPSEKARERIAGWIHLPGEPPREAPLYERELVEVGREWVAGTRRAAIQRRYLVDVGTGRVHREIARAGQRPSLGPCPRFVRAGLALGSGGMVPGRLRLLQYEVALRIPVRAKDALEAHAATRVASLADAFRAAHAEAPGQAEPFALLRPAELRIEAGAAVLVDEAGARIPLATAEGLELDAALVREAGGRPPRLVAGRLFFAEGGLILRPFSLLRGHGADASLVRLR